MAKSNEKRGQRADDSERALEQQLAEEYARINQIEELDPKILAAVKTCLERIPGRVAATPGTRRVIGELIRRLIGIIGVPIADLHGTPRELDQVIAELSGEQELGARELYKGLIALNGKTSLVQRPSRGRWTLLLRTVTDRRAAEHLRLLQETPAYRLPVAAVAPSGKRRANSGSSSEQ
ncbi:MAG: hypothetical protein IPK80_07890 [Nannocystis sp.]|nr:hypothetical protein [Nannocystis sp.]